MKFEKFSIEAMLALCRIFTIIFLCMGLVVLKETNLKEQIQGYFGLFDKMDDKLFLGVLVSLPFDCILIEESIDDEGNNSFVEAFYAFYDEEVENWVDLIEVRVRDAVQELLKPFYIHCLLDLQNFLEDLQFL